MNKWLQLCYLEHQVPLELVVGDIHLVAEEEVELGDGGQVEEDAVGNEADVILSTLTARLQ